MQTVQQVDDVRGVVVDRIGWRIVVLAIDASSVRRDDMPALAGELELSFPHAAAQRKCVQQHERTAFAMPICWSWQSFEESEAPYGRHPPIVIAKGKLQNAN